MKDQIRLRPHHLICHRLFGGKGYDEAFIDNIRSLIRRIETDRSLMIHVSPECDDICAACPHNLEGVCEYGESVTAKDASAAKFLKLPDELHMSSRQLGALLEPRLAELGSVADVCGECEWSRFCDQKLCELRAGR